MKYYIINILGCVAYFGYMFVGLSAQGELILSLDCVPPAVRQAPEQLGFAQYAKQPTFSSELRLDLLRVGLTFSSFQIISATLR